MIEYMFDQLGGRRNQSQAARTKASRLLVEQLETRLVPSGVSLHYAANANFVNGQYVPAKDGFNLADASSLSDVNSLPAGDKARRVRPLVRRLRQRRRYRCPGSGQWGHWTEEIPEPEI